MSDSSWPHGLLHARLLCPSLSPRVCSYSCPLGLWYYLIISSSASPFSFCLQSFPASRSFPVSWLFASGGQSIGASASVFPMTLQGWFSFRLTVLIPSLSKGLSRVFSSITIPKHQFNYSVLSLLYRPTLTYVCDNWKYHSFDAFLKTICFYWRIIAL